MAKREIPEINAGSMADIAFLLLIFFLVTTTMEKDTAYIRMIPKLMENPPETPKIETRNICEIAANNNNQLLFRGEPMKDPDLISEKVIEFYRMNEGLSKAEISSQIGNPGSKGYNFPFYSYITKAEIEKSLSEAEKEAERYENEANPDPELIKFKWKQVDKWSEKQKAAELYGKPGLPEIDLQAHIRVKVMTQTEYKLFAKIQSEIEEAIYELRDDAAKDIFGESYGIIKQRRAMDKKDEAKDQRKLELLEILYPANIVEVKPK